MMTRPARIALVAPNLAGGGGVSSVARFLARVIEDSDDFRCELISLATSADDSASLRLLSPKTWWGKPSAVDDTWHGRDVRHVGAYFVEFEFQRYRPRKILSRIFRDFDLVQIVAGSPAYAVVASNFPGPVALQVATLVAAERSERFKQEGGLTTAWRRLMTPVTAHFEREAIQFADQIFVENEWMKRKVEEWADTGKVTLAPPGVDTNLFRPASPSLQTNPDFILSVGRFDDRRKNVRLLFEAYAGLCAQSEDAPRLVLAGKSGPRDEDWAQVEHLGIRKRIRFHEDVSGSTLAKLYREALMVVLSSSEEGLGIVILEAMASGTPVVSTATEGAKEAVDDGRTGLLTPVGDPARLSKAMASLIIDAQLRRRMGHEGRLRAEQRYSREAAGNRFLTGYRELLRDIKRPSAANADVG